jgi:hypothetical protein
MDRRQQAEQDILKTQQDLDAMLVKVLQIVNAQIDPPADFMQGSKEVLAKAKKYASRFSERELKCEVFMLQAWNGYFEKDMETAVIASKEAFRTNPTNNDAKATQVAMSLMMDRKPLEIAPPRPRPAARDGNRQYGPNGGGGMANPYGEGRGGDPYGGGFGAPGGGSAGASTGNILNMDVDAVDMEMIGQKVGPMKLQCVNSTSFDYDPSQGNLCMLFWQVSSKSASGEPNGFSAPNARQPGRGGYGAGGGMSGRGMSGRGMGGPGYGGGMDGRGMGPGGYGGGMGGDMRGPGYGGGQPYTDSYDERYRDSFGGPEGQGYGMAGGRQGDPFTVEMSAYGNIFGSQLMNPAVRFVAINTDPIAVSGMVVQKLLENPWPWANIMAANPNSGASQYVNMDCARPKLAVVDKTGTIKYAGPAEGFLAPMMVSHLSGKPSPQAIFDGGAGTGPGTNQPTNPFTRLLFGGPSIPNPAPVVPRAVETAPPASQTKGEDEGDITPESYEAQKLLEYAKMFVQAGRKPILTSKQGVETCRRIIREYPNTKEAQEAKILLRSVPEAEQRRYGITDEEKGL